MTNQEATEMFDKKRASSYDKRSNKIASMTASLHLLTRMVLSELPENAKIICVGVGTGSELINLAQSFPKWEFTALDPASAMLDICRQRIEENGFSSRCTFHDGNLDTLPTSGYYDAATCFLVSHFFMQSDERQNFFSKIASRLCPNGYLISSDLSYDMNSITYPNILEVWFRMLKYSETPSEEIEKMRNAYGDYVALVPPLEVESIIKLSGFDAPVLFYQNLLIHAWYSRRTAN